MKRFGWLLVIVVLLLVPVSKVSAEDEAGFSIRLNRDWGYGGMGNQIQGRFSIIVKDDLDFVSVTFMMDDTEMGTLTEAPFRFAFHTDTYPPGNHTYWAVGEFADGSVIESNRITAYVLSADEANGDLGLILGIIFGTMAVGALVSWIVTNIVSKKANNDDYFDENFLPKGFNVHGGTVCPKCEKPYAYHFFSGNFLTHKLDRCPHCGKYAFTRPLSREAMADRARGMHQPEKVDDLQRPLTEEEKLRKQLEESRFLE